MQTITAQQSRDARRELGLSQANVTKALDFNRQYLSEFETGFSTRLTNAQLKKLRKFYEDKIEEANSNGEEITIAFDDEVAPSLISIESHEVKRLSFAVSHDVPDELLRDTEETIRANDKLLLEHLNASIVKDESILGDGELMPETLENLRESFALLSANYLLIRSLTGWPVFGLSASNINPAKDTVFALMIDKFKEQFPQVSAAFESATANEGDE